MFFKFAMQLKAIYYLSFFYCIILVSCDDGGTEHRFPLAERHNIDESQLMSAFDAFAQVDGALSLIVARDGEIVAEEFTNYNNYGPDSIKNVMSVTKSITAMLVGLAVDQGYIASISDPINKYLTGIVTFPDTIKANITIEQLLKMSIGHSWNGTSSSSLYNSWISSSDQLQYILDLPLVNQPGTVFNYSDGASHLLSAIITKATGQNTIDFAKENLFNLLGITKFTWTKDNDGYPIGAAGLQIKPRDMIKFGILILNRGKYNGIQIVSESWINSMTTTKIWTNNNVPYGPEYGYQIWIGSSNGYKHIFAMGWGGQFIFIVPDHNLVVSATCWTQGLNWEQAGSHWSSIINIIVNQVFPAVH
jgi:CubicO group peptidase (beta-lactamase class C family)